MALTAIPDIAHALWMGDAWQNLTIRQQAKASCIGHPSHCEAILDLDGLVHCARSLLIDAVLSEFNYGISLDCSHAFHCVPFRFLNLCWLGHYQNDAKGGPNFSHFSGVIPFSGSTMMAVIVIVKVFQAIMDSLKEIQQ